MYAQVIDSQLQTVGRLPASARRLDTGQWVMGLDAAPAAAQAACGWLPLVDPGRPNPADGHVIERAVELVDAVPTVVWTQRPKTQAELDGEVVQAERQTRDDNLSGSIATLRQWADDAAGTTVTSGNAVQVLGVVTTRLGVFFDRFADLLDNRYGTP